MSATEKARWDRRYAEGDYVPRSWPSPFLEEWLDRLPGGRALDIACGTGRNALRLAEAGYDVAAIDISETALAIAGAEAERRGLAVDWRAVDLDDFDVPLSTYDLITVIRYVNRALWPYLISGLRPGGALLIEHHLQTELPVGGPRSAGFRLRPQELLEAFGELRIVFYAETLEPADQSNQGYALARMVAFKGDPGF